MNGTIAPVPDFYGYSIFCDDIRLEIDGKVTYVGAYTSGILLVKTDFRSLYRNFVLRSSSIKRRGSSNLAFGFKSIFRVIPMRKLRLKQR
jgi:hypothetical protein